MEFKKKLMNRKKQIALAFIVAGVFVTVIGMIFGELAWSLAIFGVGLVLSGCQIILFGITRIRLDVIERQLSCLQSAISLLRVPLKSPVSFTKHSAYPDFIEIIAEIMRRRPIQYIVELGCGISSRYIVSLLAQRNSGGELVCIEDNLAWANIVQQELDLQLDSASTIKSKIVHAPLIENKQKELPFYNIDKVYSEIRPGIDLLVIDGPWDVKARKLAFTYLGEMLSKTAIIVLDDGDSPAIRDTVGKWSDESDSWYQTYYPTVKGKTVKGTWVISGSSDNINNLPLP